MADAITIKALQDASLDAKSLEEVVNGNESKQVTTRLGESYPSVKKAIKTLFENGGLPATPFKTKALMTASPLVDGKYAMVTDDTVNNGLYVKAAGAWVKSAYDPLTQSKSYTDTAKSSAISTAAADVDKKIEVTNDKSNVVDIRDGDSKSLLIIDKYGEIFPAGLNGESVQSAINSLDTKELIDIDDSNEMAINLKLSDGTTVLSIDRYGDIYPTGIDGSIQDALRGQNPPQTQNISSVTIQGEHVVGKAIYAELPKGFVADGYQWQRNGVDIEGATNSAYILNTADLYQKITVLANNINGGYEVFDNSKTTIGGVAIGEAGKAGTLYDGYVLSAGDDFNELDIIAPHKPLGKWFTTRTYLAGARGSDSLLGTMYDTDPYHVGYNDSNRGVPVGYDNMYVSDSVITLQSRKASIQEKRHFQGNRNEVAAMISSVGAFSMYAGDADGGENILEFRVRHSNRDRNPNGWHPTLWTQSSLPSVTYNSDEWDISEGTHGWSYTNYNKWGADGGKTGGSSYGIMRIFDGLWHTVTAIFSHSKYELYIDGVFNQEVLIDTNSVNEPAYALVSSHIYNGTFGFDTYDRARWDALTKGAQQDVDFIRLWRKAGKSHIKPLVTIPPINIAYGETGTITLPSKIALWGREDVLEHVQTVMTEENEPAGHHTQAYNSLPSFITYDTLTRTATINTVGQKSGRLNFVIYGYLQDGSTCEPARTYANVAPRIDVTVINMTANASYDLYAKCDCGVLVTDGVKRTKAIYVTGLPANIVYNDNTGLIYSNGAVSGTSVLTIQCINSVGQSTTKTINLIIT